LSCDARPSKHNQGSAWLPQCSRWPRQLHPCTTVKLIGPY
jgi:hypothetical protein